MSPPQNRMATAAELRAWMRYTASLTGLPPAEARTASRGALPSTLAYYTETFRGRTGPSLLTELDPDSAAAKAEAEVERVGEETSPEAQHERDHPTVENCQASGNALDVIGAHCRDIAELYPWPPEFDAALGSFQAALDAWVWDEN